MKLFKMKGWVVEVEEEVWLLQPFKKLLDRDKTKDKAVALKEMAFIYFYTDIKSDYLITASELERADQIKIDLGLPDKWKIDSTIQVAIDFYRKQSITVIGKLYTNSLKAVDDISNYLYNTDVLLAERDANGKIVTDISKITASVKQVKSLMQDLRAAEQEVIKEAEELNGRNKGARSLALFEDGLTFE